MGHIKDIMQLILRGLLLLSEGTKIKLEIKLEELRKRVQVLEDIEAIKKLKGAYVRALDARLADHADVENIAKLFTEDGVWYCKGF